MKTVTLAILLTVGAIMSESAYSDSPAVNISESLGELGARLARESNEAYKASPFSALSKDYFNRFSRDPEAKPGPDELLIDETWTIVIDEKADPLTERMAGHLLEFLDKRMGVKPLLEKRPSDKRIHGDEKTVLLLDTQGGDPAVPGSYHITVGGHQVMVRGVDADGLRDGIVKLVDLMGFREAPILKNGFKIYRPRIGVRLGAVPWMGSHKDLVFMGYNAVFANSGSLYALSTSDAIPELKSRRIPNSLANLVASVSAARRYGLKVYCFTDIRQKFPKDDPIFKAHPEIRGALTWSADGEYVLCTEHPLVKQFLTESAKGIFKAAPDLDGLMFIIGGEGFYHCFMRSHGTEKGHTNCTRCEAIGADTVVANLVNNIAESIQSVNPNAEAIAWPYSAEHVWSLDKPHTGFITKLKPGTAIFTEIEKDEYVQKPDGVNKHLWDYSIDMIGPGERAKQQVELCKKQGISIYMKSEPELAFEAPRLPHIPCLDRWYDRGDALVTCGADGAWVFPAFRNNYGSSAAEINKFIWWEPVTERETFLNQFAARIAGRKAAPHLRKAWKSVSEAIAWSPELPVYYTGPYYLGPAHPMCASPTATVPEVFNGYYLYLAEMADAEGVKKRPTYYNVAHGNVPVFGRFYREMERLLKQAVDEIDAASPMVDERHRLMFESEASPIRWFYHTARTEANFYESCPLRDELLALAAKPSRTPEEVRKAEGMYKRWREVMLDEKANAEAALPVVEKDVRLDCYYGGDHSFSHAADMIRAKLEIIEEEINVFLPEVAGKCGQ